MFSCVFAQSLLGCTQLARSTVGAFCPPLHKTQMIYSFLPQSVQAFSAMKMLEI
jgi:hypothetical protein